jgi:hypothetical protein
VDETSIDLGVKIAEGDQGRDGRRLSRKPFDDVLFALADKRPAGAQGERGFYAYDDTGKRQGLWPELRALWPARTEQPDSRTVQRRLAMIQTLEAVRALEDGVLTDIREGRRGRDPRLGLHALGRAGPSPGSTSSARSGRRRSAKPSRAPTAPASPRPPSCASWRRRDESFYGRAQVAAA